MMRKWFQRRSKFFICLLIFVVFAGCVSSGDLDKLKGDLNQKIVQQNKKIQTDLENAAQNLNKTIAQQNSKIKQIEKIQTVKKALMLIGRMKKEYKILENNLESHKRAYQNQLQSTNIQLQSLKRSQNNLKNNLASFAKGSQNINQRLSSVKISLEEKIQALQNQLSLHRTMLNQFHYYQYRLFSLIESQCVPGSELPIDRELIILKAT